MAKKEIVDTISASAGISKKDTAAVISSLLVAITATAMKGALSGSQALVHLNRVKTCPRRAQSRYRCHDRHPGFYRSGFQGRQGI